MKRKILLADDDDDDHLIFTDAINRIDPDIEYDIAINSKKVLEALNEKKALPDVIFIDINMPLLNGFECLAKIKSMEEFAAIPIVIFSTTTNQSAIETARTLGASLFLSKPPNHNQLIEKLSLVFEILFSNLPGSKKITPVPFYI